MERKSYEEYNWGSSFCIRLHCWAIVSSSSVKSNKGRDDPGHTPPMNRSSRISSKKGWLHVSRVGIRSPGVYTSLRWVTNKWTGKMNHPLDDSNRQLWGGGRKDFAPRIRLDSVFVVLIIWMHFVHFGSGRSAQHSNDFDQLIDTAFAGKDWFTENQFSHHAASRPNVNGRSVIFSPEYKLRRAVIARTDIRYIRRALHKNFCTPWTKLFDGQTRHERVPKSHSFNSCDLGSISIFWGLMSRWQIPRECT